MPVVTCPKCPTKLKIPDGAKGNVKCPKCGTVFPAVAPQPSAAFEVVDDAPPPKPATGTGSKPTAPLSKPPVKAAAADEGDDFEVVDEKPKTKKKATSDDEDDDDEDEKPKSKKKKRASDDDDEDDEKPKRKKKKKKRASDDDDEDDWQPQTSNRGAFAKGKTGAQLLSIAFWLNGGSFALLTLYALIAWIALIAATSSTPSSGGGRSSSSSGGDGGGMASVMEVLIILPGLLGLGAWIVGLVGCAFSIAGPAKARGMAITATVMASIHLILVGVTFSNLHGSRGLGMGGLGAGMGSPAWMVVASTLPVLDTFLPLLFYQSKAIGGDYVIALLAGIFEILRLVFMLLTLKGLATAARDFDAVGKSQSGLLFASFIAGGAALAVLLMVLLLAEGGVGMKTGLHLGMITILLVLSAYTFMMLNPAMAALQTKDACNRRS